MGTYFEGNSEIQGGDGLQTLVLMNPGYVQYSDAAVQPGNLVFLANSIHAPPVQSVGQSMQAQAHHNLWTSTHPTRAQQGLSLSLSSHQPGVSTMQSSKYLKAAQELLDEVANVGNYGMKLDSSKNKSAGEGSIAADLSTVDRQEIQMKKAKLISMLDEVEQRYRQYHQQMQIVTSSFEQVAGMGSAKAYTWLALETISKQFRCLKDAIRGASKRLGEEECVEGSRLKYVDRHLPLPHHNAWRPQRGLPQPSVSVLRAWLFQHFLHPYPKDSDKHMLAKQAGLTRSQVSNWFINARVRLWKPMVEEMYMEELKEQEQNGSEDKTMSKGEDSASMSQSKSPNGNRLLIMNSNQDNSISNHDTPSMATTPSSASPLATNVRNQSVFPLLGASELEEFTQSSPKKPRSVDTQKNMISMEFGSNERSANFIGSFGEYPIGEIGRFDTEQQQYTPRFSGNGVSLTLGLPHCENLSLSGTHQSFLQSQNMNQLGRRVDQLSESNEFDHMMGASTPHSSSAYENINIQNRKSFAAQLLPDFVA